MLEVIKRRVRDLEQSAPREEPFGSAEENARRILVLLRKASGMSEAEATEEVEGLIEAQMADELALVRDEHLAGGFAELYEAVGRQPRLPVQFSPGCRFSDMRAKKREQKTD